MCLCNNGTRHRLYWRWWLPASTFWYLDCVNGWDVTSAHHNLCLYCQYYFKKSTLSYIIRVFIRKIIDWIQYCLWYVEGYYTTGDMDKLSILLPEDIVLIGYNVFEGLSIESNCFHWYWFHQQEVSCWERMLSRLVCWKLNPCYSYEGSKWWCI